MNKKELTEADIRTKFITPALVPPGGGWDLMTQLRAPEDLWGRFSKAKGYTAAQEVVTTQDYYDDGSGKAPRYYQLIAINRTVEAIARGEDRILPVMATGTGKTHTAFQIIWRLW